MNQNQDVSPDGSVSPAAMFGVTIPDQNELQKP